MKDPFVELNEHFLIMANSVAMPNIGLAEVISPPPAIKLRYGDIQLDKDDLYVADYLLNGYSRHISIAQASATGQVKLEGSPTHIHQNDTVGIPNTTVTTLDTLKKGDYIALYQSADKQNYIVLAKVVRC